MKENWVLKNKKADLKAMYNAYSAAYEAQHPYKIYPTLEDGFYAYGQRASVDPFEF